jgi:branched-chain amino acid transport system ATP-binding protein
MSDLLRVEALNAYYGKSHILRDVSLSVGKGEIVALLGLNGAGKTTTMRCILGLMRLRSGAVAFEGNAITGWPAYRIARLGIGYVPEGRRMFKDLTTLENLQLAENGRTGEWTIARVMEHLPKLGELRARKAGRLSGGEQEMLSIGRALLLNPKLLILDEPSQGLAPLIVREVFRIVSQMREEGISVLLVEQNARMSLEIADHAYVLDDGSIVYSGPARELAADEARVQALAGASAQEWSE